MPYCDIYMVLCIRDGPGLALQNPEAKGESVVEDYEGDKIARRCPQDDVEGGGEVGKRGVISLAYLDHQDGPGECDGNSSCAVQEAVIQLLVLGKDRHKG